MSWLEEAQQKIQQKQQQNNIDQNSFSPDQESQREQLVNQLKMTYDNASEREINKAVDEALEKFDPPYDKADFMRFLRMKLED